MLTTLLLLTAMAVQAPSSGGAPDPTGGAATRAPRRGIGLLVAGAGLLGIGAAVTIAASAMFAADARCHRNMNGECWDGLAGAITMPFGMLGLAVGAPLVAVGVHRHGVWRAWQRERGLTLLPRIGRSDRAWTVGLTLRF